MDFFEADLIVLLSQGPWQDRIKLWNIGRMLALAGHGTHANQKRAWIKFRSERVVTRWSVEGLDWQVRGGISLEILNMLEMQQITAKFEDTNAGVYCRGSATGAGD